MGFVARQHVESSGSGVQLRPLHWQVDSLPPDSAGKSIVRLKHAFLNLFFTYIQSWFHLDAFAKVLPLQDL